MTWSSVVAGTAEEESWKQWWWQCGVCGYWSPAQKNKCGSCGCKKAVAADLAPKHDKRPGGSMGDFIWPALREHQAGRGPVVPRPPPSPTPSSTVTWATSVQPATPPAQRQASSDASPVPSSQDIKAIEAAINAMPASQHCDETRKMLEDRLSLMKRAVTLSKPTASQLATTVAAHDRAMKRLGAADAAAQRAAEEVSKAQGEVDALASEVSRLKATIGGDKPARSSLETMADSFRVVLDEMSDSPSVPADIVASAKLNMERLHSDLFALAAQTRAPVDAVRPLTVHRAAATAVTARLAGPSAPMASASAAAAAPLPATPPRQPVTPPRAAMVRSTSLPQLCGDPGDHMPLCHAVPGPPRPVLRVRQKLRPAPYVVPAPAHAGPAASMAYIQPEDGDEGWDQPIL